MRRPDFPLETPLYRLHEELGQGGMSQVWLAFSVERAHDVALKIVQPTHSPERAQELIARFKREANILSELQHPHIIRFYEYFQEADNHIIAMEYVKGGSLRRRIYDDGYRFSSEEVCNIGHDIINALGTTHDRGVVHRDLKPSNILLTEHNAVRLSDFGIARLKTSSPLHNDLFQTQIGQPGTLYYMAPELLANGRRPSADERCDIWSLGIVFYEMLSGHVPWQGPTADDVINEICNMPLPPLEAEVPDLWPGLKEILSRMLDKNPMQRYRSMWQLIGDLDQVLHDRGDSPKATELVSAIRRIKERRAFSNGEAGSQAILPSIGKNKNHAPSDLGPHRADYTASRALLLAPTLIDTDAPAQPDMAESVALLADLLAERLHFDVTLLTGQAATYSAINQALVDLQTCQEDDRLLIYYAGQARSRHDRRGNEFSFLAASDTRWANWQRFLDANQLLDTRFLDAKHIMFIVDAPTLGPVDTFSTNNDVPFTVERAMRNPALHVLCAGTQRGSVVEQDTLFSQLVYEGLSGAAQEHGIISADSLGRYVLQQSAALTEGQHQPVYARLPNGDSGCMLFHVPTTAYLPIEVLDSLRSESSIVRAAMIQALHDFANQAQPAMRRAALEQLQHLAQHDPVESIKEAARHTLTQLEDLRRTDTAPGRAIPLTDTSSG